VVLIQMGEVFAPFAERRFRAKSSYLQEGRIPDRFTAAASPPSSRTALAQHALAKDGFVVRSLVLLAVGKAELAGTASGSIPPWYPGTPRYQIDCRDVAAVPYLPDQASRRGRSRGAADAVIGTTPAADEAVSVQPQAVFAQAHLPSPTRADRRRLGQQATLLLQPCQAGELRVQWMLGVQERPCGARPAG
jgi:hypothetical protein